MNTVRCAGINFLAITIMISIGCNQENGDGKLGFEIGDQMPNVENQKIEILFDSFRNDCYEGHAFPDLSFADIPALLDLGESKRILKTFPRNPISSQYESKCREGIIALWLIEGLRIGNRFPSLNALCFEKGQTGGDWTAKSEANHLRLLDAYRKWWLASKLHSNERAKAMEPLLELNLHWH